MTNSLLNDKSSTLRSAARLERKSFFAWSSSSI